MGVPGVIGRQRLDAAQALAAVSQRIHLGLDFGQRQQDRHTVGAQGQRGEHVNFKISCSAAATAGPAHAGPNVKGQSSNEAPREHTYNTCKATL